MKSLRCQTTTILYLCLVATLFGIQGCADDNLDEPINESTAHVPGDPHTPVVGGDTSEQEPSPDVINTPDDSQPPTQGEPDGTEPTPAEPDPQGGSGEDPNESDACNLDGVSAVKIVAQVSWPESLAMEQGSGTFEIWFKADMNDDGQNVLASGHVCEVSVPDFRTKPLAGGDTHGTVIPGDAWASGPRTTLNLELGGRSSGSTLSLEPTAMFLGTQLPDPMGAWPASSTSLESVDHDGDGYPGVTSYATMGSGYSNPRIALLNPNLRANRIFLGMRNIIGFDGMLTNCDRAEGTTTLSLDQRSFGCLTPEGTECTAQQTGLLDGNMPQFEVQQATFTLQKLYGATDCAAVRTELP
jgi:hypothetical protein